MEIVIPFRFNVLCKITWSVQDVLLKKENMWDQMFQHVCNIWTLSADLDGCCFERNFC